MKQLCGMAYTPGPWRTTSRHDIVADAGDGWVVTIASLVEARFCDPPSIALVKEQVDANAHLLNAAPDLFAACKHVVEHYREAFGPAAADFEAYQLCFSAMRKAAGSAIAAYSLPSLPEEVTREH